MVLLGKNNEIAVSRGDSAYIIIDMTGKVPRDGTEALFTVKKKLQGEACIIKKLTIQDGSMELDLKSQDTNKLKPGDYYWDLRILYSDTDVGSPVEPILFKVMEVAGDV